MKRYLDAYILKDLPAKMVVLTGPRQVGKTTLYRQLMEVDFALRCDWSRLVKGAVHWLKNHRPAY